MNVLHISTRAAGGGVGRACPVDRPAARTTLGLGADEKVLLFAATSLADPRKGADLLLKALGRLPGPDGVACPAGGPRRPGAPHPRGADGRQGVGLPHARSFCLGLHDEPQVLATCSTRHTHNCGGCVCVRKEWLMRMNGYEQVPFMAGYHYCDRDNYTRFKNMGLKVMWHPTQRVYHGWHATPQDSKRSTIPEQERLIVRRAATWDWLAYDGIDPTRNRRYDPDAPLPSDWHFVRTEYAGNLLNPGVPAPRVPLSRRVRTFFPRHGLAGGLKRLAAKLVGRARS